MSVNSLAVLKKYWGYNSFRPMQEEVINSILEKKDTIALLATGAGKSICFQVPAMVMEGKTLVISPLVALMQDQVKTLESRGIFAKAIYSGLGKRHVDLYLDNFVNGPLKILYVSPERLETDIFLERFKKTNVSLIAVDEAHCISQWGHDFRPSYFNIAKLREIKPNVPIIAVTATATEKVVADIQDKLDTDNAAIFRSTYARNNLSFTVMLTEGKESALTDALSKLKGSGIIYLRSRSKVKAVSNYLNDLGIKSDFYHGGMSMADRMDVQQNWIDNKVRIIVCTNAFGMGVDKPDVRFVIHLDVPPSIEEYYQEAGRAGRDGIRAFALSIVGYRDIVKLQYHFEITFPKLEIIIDFYNKLCSFLRVGVGSGAGETFTFSMEQFSNLHRMNIGLVYSCLNILEKESWLFLNDAFRHPSKILITSDKNSISLSARNESIKAKMLVYLLRKYEGLFVDYTIIDEGQMANDLSLDKQTIIRELTVMKNEGIIAYQKASTDPQLTFLLDRPEIKSFTIDKLRYKERKENAFKKMNAIQDYVTSDGCRQQFILAYFGEKSSPCGACDICKGSKEKVFSQDDANAVFDHLKKKINEKPLTIESYIGMYPFNKKNKVFACINFLIKENKIEIDTTGMVNVKQ